MTIDSSNEIKKKQSLRNIEYYDMQEILDDLYKQSKENQKFKHLVEIIQSKENIELAYRNIKTNDGKNTPGVDKIILEDIEELNLEEYIPLVQSALDNYSPGMVRRVEIPKPDGSKRPLGIPTVTS
jgi:retron-type reverse transcriptase